MKAARPLLLYYAAVAATIAAAFTILGFAGVPFDAIVSGIAR